MRRRLTLSRETLPDLTPADLAAVQGAALPTLEVFLCLTIDWRCIVTTV